MIYTFMATEDGAPKTGLSPSWQSLVAIDGTDKIGSAPAISEIGSTGIYKYEILYGTAPFDVNQLTGIIDCDSSLNNYERYIKADMTLRDAALFKLVNKASHTLISGVTKIRNDEDDDDELTLAITEVDGVETRITS